MFKKRKTVMAVSTKDEVSAMVRAYFEKGGTITVCPPRYALGHYRSTLVSTSKAR